jgi:membrane-associated phospholipid phosphatase
MSFSKVLLPKICWHKSHLIFIHSLALGLICTWFLPITHSFWVYIDTKAFYFFNSLVSKFSWVQIFWAFSNTSKNDWVFDIIMFVFFLSYILGNKRQEVKERSVKMFISILFMLFICGLNRLIFHRFFLIERLSPSLVLETTRLSQLVPWLHVKESASTCYPGDHGITAFSFILIATFNMKWSKTLIAAALATPCLILPRLVAGAHWLSDVILGSFLVCIIPATWLFYTPIYGWITHQFIKMIERKKAYHGKEKNPRPYQPDST